MYFMFNKKKQFRSSQRHHIILDRARYLYNSEWWWELSGSLLRGNKRRAFLLHTNQLERWNTQPVLSNVLVTWFRFLKINFEFCFSSYFCIKKCQRWLYYKVHETRRVDSDVLRGQNSRSGFCSLAELHSQLHNRHVHEKNAIYLLRSDYLFPTRWFPVSHFEQGFQFSAADRVRVWLLRPKWHYQFLPWRSF